MSKTISNTTCHCLKMRRSAGNVVDFYDNILAPSGMTVRQYSLLNKIAENEGCSMRELSEATELDRSTLTRSLKPLFKEELIEDRKEKTARNSVLFLTEDGASKCRQAADLWNHAQKAFEDKIGVQNILDLERILEMLETL